MSTNAEEAASLTPADTVTLDAYLGRGGSAAPSPSRAAWPRHEQLTARFEWYRHMRQHHPVALDPQSGLWGVFRYDDVRRGLDEFADFGNQLPSAPDDPITDTMLRVDPPRHRELRSLVNQGLTSRRVAAMRDQVRVISTDLVRSSVEGDRLDVVTSIARGMPTLVIASLLGIDVALRDDFQRWTDAFMQSLMHGPDAEQSAILAEMDRYFDDIIAERRQRPGTDLISAAVLAEADGAHLTDRDILQFCKLLLIAGSETTTHLITNTVLCLQQDPPLLQRVRRDPAMLPSVIEEVLRFASPIQAAPKCANRDVTLYDQVIPAGAMVYLWIGSANRDPDVFDDADTFSIDRAPGKHIAFGHGIHFCVGAALARIEAETVLTTMLAELPGEWTVPDNVPIYPAHEMCGLSSLPLTWH
jgi:cytochrome P450